MAETFLHNVDTNKVSTLMNETQERVKYFEDIVSTIVSDYTRDLDSVMQNIRKTVVDVENPSLNSVEKAFLELSNQLYYTQEKAEKLNLYDAISKSVYKEVYNKAYLENQIKDAEKKNKTTVAENQAVAETASVYESTVNDLYSKSYKTIKLKIDAAQTMVSTLSKVMSRRIQEYSSDKAYTASGLRILNENASNKIDEIF